MGRRATKVVRDGVGARASSWVREVLRFIRHRPSRAAGDSWASRALGEQSMIPSTESLTQERRRLRFNLGLSRSEFARFLGVSEATVVRWESDKAMSEPKGLQAILLSALDDATQRHSNQEIASLVRSCGLDHRAALRTLLDVSR